MQHAFLPGGQTNILIISRQHNFLEEVFNSVERLKVQRSALCWRAPYLADLDRSANHAGYARQRASLAALGVGHHAAVPALQRDLAKLYSLPARDARLWLDHLFQGVKKWHDIKTKQSRRLTALYYYILLCVNTLPHIFTRLCLVHFLKKNVNNSFIKYWSVPGG